MGEGGPELISKILSTTKMEITLRDNRCSNCEQKILSHHRTVTCSLCGLKWHNSCLPLYDPDDIEYARNTSNNWSCPTCLKNVFPFHIIESNEDLQSTLLVTTCNFNIEKASKMIFDPYDILEEDNESDNDDLDPDQNFYQEYERDIKSKCLYYDIQSLNKSISTNSKDKFSICHLNIRSLQKNHGMLLNVLSTIDNTFDIIILTETWLKPHNVDIYSIEDYNHEFLLRPDKPGGGTLHIY
jgi:hypothetical protein